MTQYQFKNKFLRKNPGSYFFSRGTMEFFGDSLDNFYIDQLEGGRILKLGRRNPVKFELASNHYFNAETMKEIYGYQEIKGDK